MPLVDLAQEEWQQIVNILATKDAPWVVTNPLLMKINQQLQQGGSIPPLQKRNSGKEHEQPGGF